MNRNRLILISLVLGGAAYYLMTRKKTQVQAPVSLEPVEPPSWADVPLNQAVQNHEYNPNEQCPPHTFVEGCTHPQALNYNPCASYGQIRYQCEFADGTVIGCGDSTKCNYDPNVTVNVQGMCFTDDFCDNYWSGTSNSVAFRGSSMKMGLHPLY